MARSRRLSPLLRNSAVHSSYKFLKSRMREDCIFLSANQLLNRKFLYRQFLNRKSINHWCLNIVTKARCIKSKTSSIFPLCPRVMLRRVILYQLMLRQCNKALTVMVPLFLKLQSLYCSNLYGPPHILPLGLHKIRMRRIWRLAKWTTYRRGRCCQDSFGGYLVVYPNLSGVFSKHGEIQETTGCISMLGWFIHVLFLLDFFLSLLA